MYIHWQWKKHLDKHKQTRNINFEIKKNTFLFHIYANIF